MNCYMGQYEKLHDLYNNNTHERALNRISELEVISLGESHRSLHSLEENKISKKMSAPESIYNELLCISADEVAGYTLLEYSQPTIINKRTFIHKNMLIKIIIKTKNLLHGQNLIKN